MLTGTDLGVNVDATALADTAFAEHPALEPRSLDGRPRTGGDRVRFREGDRGTARRSADELRRPRGRRRGLRTPASGTFVITPSETGTGIDVAGLNAAFTEAVGDGRTTLEYSGDAATAQPAVSDDDATATASTLNTMLPAVGFYVGEERTVPVDPAVAASWLSVVDDDGQLRIEADPQAIQATRRRSSRSRGPCSGQRRPTSSIPPETCSARSRRASRAALSATRRTSRTSSPTSSRPATARSPSRSPETPVRDGEPVPPHRHQPELAAGRPLREQRGRELLGPSPPASPER